ncbi:ketopantoate reductase family protein [Ammoniphilus resinae]|uniref:2-dehydropantoate 2-reductase n=1 Tax=Ammoniphilus resinae TaxID=861532 RepID=A0ABS4GSL4_9BACL|nr:ketopantoate reductase family protein [Ammoniphilus resinae]MBP1933273.1 2-dehydropantoate 2-reductase [Ammoniphilus resinae]
MRTLVLGAGAIGGYFGGRLLEKGEDITFLVRENRQKELRQNGLVLKSDFGDITVSPKTITVNDSPSSFDLIIFSTKAYHLEQAIADIKPFVGEHTVILPLLNGIAHVPLLKRELGEQNVIGGLCYVSATLDDKGTVIQSGPNNRMVIGEFDRTPSKRIEKIKHLFTSAKTTCEISDNIEQEMWHKYLFIATMSGVTTLFRSPMGAIRSSEGSRSFLEGLSNEVRTVMERYGAPLSEGISQKHLASFDSAPYGSKASMLKDMEKGAPLEGDHIHGYLLKLSKELNLNSPLLEVVYSNLEVYQSQIG